ncbi:MAG: hydroxymethylbilane synthase [Armatimonadetes bacterium]|nr:hydroxymethylbilane synthase [Armatimonadota bacterium]
MIISRIRLGTRGSRLALAQAESVRAQLLALQPDAEVEITVVKTSGDLGKRERLGAFVGEIQDALLEGRVDVGLHCLKDLPTRPVPGLRLSAYLEREDPRDTLISRGHTIASLPEGAVVGTGSLRRTSQLAAIRSDLVFRPLVGNVDTRMRKLMSGEYDAIILAVAGLIRLDLMANWHNGDYRELQVLPLSPEEMLPSAGQAVLVLETREGDVEAHEWVRGLDHAPSRVSAIAERAFLNAFGGGCSLPVASLAQPVESGYSFSGLVSSPDGQDSIRAEFVASEATLADEARQMAEAMILKGALSLFEPRSGVL